MANSKVVIAIDYGTWKCAFAYSIVTEGARPERGIPLQVGVNDHEVRTIATWKDGRLIHGCALGKLAAEDPVVADKIVHLFKLGLYRSAETSAISANVDQLLSEFPGNKTLDDLITDHLEALIRDATNKLYASETILMVKSPILQSLPIEVRLTVPAMWTPQARRRMQTAAKRTGVQAVTLASEPQCALSYLLARHASIAPELEGEMVKDKVILVADLGGGTGDFVMYRLKEDLARDSRVEAIAQSSGDICGSAAVEQLVLDKIAGRKKSGWMAQKAKNLGITERDFNRRALLAIEEVKKKFDTMPSAIMVAVQGARSNAKLVQVRKADIDSALDEVITRIIEKLDQMSNVQHDTGVGPDILMITGGFAESNKLFDRVTHRYPTPTTKVIRPALTKAEDTFPVASGALLRYDSISTQRLPALYGYAMLSFEAFHEELHKDAYKMVKLGNGRERKYYHPKVAKHDPYSQTPGDRLLEDRIINTLPKGKILGANEKFTWAFGRIYHLPFDNLEIGDEFVYLTKDFEDHAPSTVPVGAGGPRVFVDGVQPWAEIKISIKKEDLENKGLETCTLNGKTYWKFWASVLVEAHGQDMRIRYEVHKPDKYGEFEDEEGRGTDGTYYPTKVVAKFGDTIWDGTHSDFLELTDDAMDLD